MSYEEHVVRAKFTPHGKEYAYIVPGAQVGDVITGPGATGDAIVVGYGRTSYTGPLKHGTFVKRGENGMHEYRLNEQRPGTTKQTPVEQLTEMLVAEKARERAARKSAKAARKAAAERDRIRAVVQSTLERVAGQEEDHAAAVAASVQLLKLA